jgi:Leucine Rich repeat
VLPRNEGALWRGRRCKAGQAASPLSALVLLLLAGALRADPPGVVERLRRLGADVGQDHSRPGLPVDLVVLRPAAGDADLAGLCELRRLGFLELAETGVTDDGLRLVSELRALRTLRLNGAAGVTDEGLRHLEAMAGLKVLDLRGCPNVTDEGVARLKKALPRCRVVR